MSELAQPTSTFYQRYRGSFTSVLRWPQLDEFWLRLRASAEQGWYVYQLGEAVPQVPLNASQFEHFITEIDQLIRQEHQEEYCGVVYADNLQQPTFIKIYDPNNLGVVCGFSENPPLPGWILTTMPPQPLDQHTFASQSRKRWWQRLFAG